MKRDGVERGRIVKAILEAVAAGEELSVVCEERGISPRTFTRWTEAVPEWSAARGRAFAMCAYIWAEKAQRIADGTDELTVAYRKALDTLDPVRDRQLLNKLDFALVNRDRLRVETLYRRIKAFAPQQFGEQMELRVKGEARHSVVLLPNLDPIPKPLGAGEDKPEPPQSIANPLPRVTARITDGQNGAPNKETPPLRRYGD